MNRNLLIEQYDELCQHAAIKDDVNQRLILHALQPVYDALLQKCQKRRGLLGQWRTKKPIKGLYVYGGVGIGKTFVMDLFYRALPFPQKMRMHFHAFMRRIHAELKLLQGQVNPLQKLAKKIAKETYILCFDEFFVNDITDAMLLAKLLEALFAEGVSLIATSNIAPDLLYEKGLQRPLFLPAIALIKQYCQVLAIDSQQDYRLMHLRQNGVLHYPHTAATQLTLQSIFENFADADEQRDDVIINDRRIPVVKRSTTIAWFTFATLCETARSKFDYLSIAQAFSTLIISEIPIIHSRDVATRFISLIDILYDMHVRVIFSTYVPFQQLYQQGPLQAAFQRTLSRLQEMTSEKYYTEQAP